MEEMLRAPDFSLDEVATVAQKAPLSAVGGMVLRGVTRLLNEWSDGFSEAAHWMSFPRSQGFSGPEEEHCGDLFHRALVLDTLADFREWSRTRLSSVFQTGIEHILQQRRTTGVGGWSYFPKLRELPADADDLAQVMQVFLRNGRRDAVMDFCDRPLNILLEDNSHPDGSLETWIIPRKVDNELALQLHWAEIAWGTGPDVEVMANALYALWLFDRSKYQNAIERGASFLASRQKADGHWTSTWYHSPLYGTWVCLRLFEKLGARFSAEVERGREYLLNQQRSDGGWGLEAISDPLSTSLALLGLAASTDGKTRTEVDWGLNWLSLAQQADGGWSATPFIRMQLGRPTGKPWMTLSYGSRTISTNFAVKAALAWAGQENSHDNGNE